MITVNIEKDIPIPDRRKESSRLVYAFLEEMRIGESFVYEGTPEELKAFRSAIRTRNWRHKGHMQWVWRWVGHGVMRIWRTE